MRWPQIPMFSVLGLALAALAFSPAGPAAGATAQNPAAPSSYTINPGVPWTDTSGNLIQAHGGSIIKDNDTYYWIGADNSGSSGTSQGFDVACYSSADLVHWTFVKEVLDGSSAPASITGYLMQRPKVILNPDGTYVMYMHVEPAHTSGTITRLLHTEVAVATSTPTSPSTSPCDNTYTFTGAFRPLGNPSYDIGLFKDSNGDGYLLSENPGCTTKQGCSSTSAKGLYIYRLSSDYTQVTGTAPVKVLADYEAPDMFRTGQGTSTRYYLVASPKHGWLPSPDVYTSATTISGLGSSWKDIAPASADTYSSQVSFVLPVTGSSGTTYIYIGDRWDSPDLGSSEYVWLPLTVNGATLGLNWVPSWNIDVSAGTSHTLSTPPYFMLTNVDTSKVLEVYRNSTLNRGTVDQFADNGGTNQQWQIVDAGYAGSTPVYQLFNRNSGKVLEDKSFSTSCAVGTVDQYTNHDGTNQQWEFVSGGDRPGGDGGHGLALVNRYSQLLLQVDTSGSGEPVNQCNNASQTQGYFGTANQEWRISQTPGYWAYTADGNIYNEDTSPWYGSEAGKVTGVAGMAVTPDGGGYWLVTSGGTVYSFGDAAAVSPITAAGPVTGAVSDPAADGFWAYTADGNVYNEGAAPSYGSEAGKVTGVAGMAVTPDGGGYWLVTSGGTVYSFGDAAAVSPITAAGPVTGAVGDPAADGFWAYTADGNVYNEGAAPSYGSEAGKVTGVAGMAVTPDGGGYWLVTSGGTVCNLGDATGTASQGTDPCITGSVASSSSIIGALADPNM